MQIPAEYVAAMITPLCGVIAFLFRLYVKSQEALLSEKESKVNILAELKRLIEERKRRANP